jgi:hypothetical protein
MINAQTETISKNLNTLCVALVNHAMLLKSGLTPYEAQCATLNSVVVQALDSSTPRVQENFGRYMQFQVEQSRKENCTSLDFVTNNVISLSDHLEKKDQKQQALAWDGAVTPYLRTYG